jgi:predicted Zn-dependent peptidase
MVPLLNCGAKLTKKFNFKNEFLNFCKKNQFLFFFYLSYSLLLLWFNLLRMEFFTHVLPNGIKLIHIPNSSAVAHCGFFINTGTRDEDINEQGMAHFIEHLIFKGTKKRKSFHVLSRLEDVGGELNAYTTKEETCIHASFLKEHYQRTFELLADILFNSSFPDKAIESEKDVVIDEINSYKDSPSELIFDEFEEKFFGNHPLSRPILGRAKYLNKYQRASILSFIAKNYNTDQMVLATVGNISDHKVQYYFEKYFKDIPTNLRTSERLLFSGYTPFFNTKKRNTFQVHALIGSPGYDLKDSRRVTLHLLSNIIGGPGMISRLNLALRERKGLSYNVESSFTPYSDTGLFNIYFSTDKDKLEKCFDIINKELKYLCATPLGAIQLKKAKQQVTGQLAISYESFENQMLSIGKSFLVYDRVDTIDEIFTKIDVITSADLLDIANDVLQVNKLSYLIYK